MIIEIVSEQQKEYEKLKDTTDNFEMQLPLTKGQLHTQKQCAKYGKHLLSEGALRHHVSSS